MKFRLRKDRFVGEDNTIYMVFGMNVYEGWKRIRVIKYMSLNKKNLREFIRQCNRNKVGILHLDDVVRDYIEGESMVEEKPCFL